MDQFNHDQLYYFQKLDFLNWYRYYFIIKAIDVRRSAKILEIGTGSGMVRNCLMPLVEEYVTFDISPNLRPDIVGDMRTEHSELRSRFDWIVIADVLEHVQFDDMETILRNINGYLSSDGHAIITIPHRRSHFLFMTPHYVPHVITVPTGFLSIGAFYRRFIKKKIWIDPDHCWEIGDGKIKKKDVESAFFKTGFIIERYQKLLYVDFWVLSRA